MPTKATYRALDDEPGFWWEFFLTEKLGFRTREELVTTMPNKEFHQWVIFYQKKQQQQELAEMKSK